MGKRRMKKGQKWYVKGAESRWLIPVHKTIEDGSMEHILDNKEKKLLIELICNEQTHMIIKDHTEYDSEKYKSLEILKIKIKDM